MDRLGVPIQGQVARGGGLTRTSCGVHMRCCAALLGLLIAACALPQSARAIESPGQLARYCQKLEKGARGTGDNIQIPNSREALLCWGYMQAIQDLSMLAD